MLFRLCRARQCFLALLADGLSMGFIIPDDAFTRGGAQSLRQFLREKRG